VPRNVRFNFVKIPDDFDSDAFRLRPCLIPIDRASFFFRLHCYCECIVIVIERVWDLRVYASFSLSIIIVRIIIIIESVSVGYWSFQIIFTLPTIS